MAKVVFTFEDESLEPIEINGIEKGKSILEITEEKGIYLNHNCGGVCACSTCHIYVNKGNDFLPEISDSEENFIDRAIDPRLESRLACQSVILSKDAVLEIEIPDQSNIIGHEH